MNLFQLVESLPNGLHDATLQRLTIDYTRRTAVLDLEIWVDDTETRELYRPARITLTAFAYLAIQPPDATYPFRDAGAVTIDLSEIDKSAVPGFENDSAFRLFVSEFNSFIHADAPEAELEWLGESAPH